MVLRIERERTETSEARFSLVGRLRGHELETLQSTLRPFIDGCSRLTLDLSRLQFLDQVSAHHLHSLRQRGIRLEFPSGYVRELLQTLEPER